MGGWFGAGWHKKQKIRFCFHETFTRIIPL